MVTHWQLAACELGPLRHQVMFEQLLFPWDRTAWNEAHQSLPVKGSAPPSLLHCKEYKNHCEFKVCQRSFQGGLDFTILWALNYLYYMLSMWSSGSCWRGIEVTALVTARPGNIMKSMICKSQLIMWNQIWGRKWVNQKDSSTLDPKCPYVTEHSPSQVAIAVPYYSASCY